MINQLKTMVLLALLTALLLWVGSLFGAGGLLIAGVIVIVMNFLSYFFSDKFVLMIYRAKPASRGEHRILYKIMEELSQKAKIPMPKLYIIPSSSPNAFATGRNPKHAAVACTEGILRLMSEEELKGVLAHEISHVTNRDILVTTIAATIAGIISYVASMAQWAAIFGGFGGRDDEDGGGMLQLLVLAILTPIIATLLQLAISRSREYLADQTGAGLSGDPKSLASALGKLKTGIAHDPMHMGTPATSSLFIANPFNTKGFLTLFSTHPDLDDRIERLKKMKG